MFRNPTKNESSGVSQMESSSCDQKENLKFCHAMRDTLSLSSVCSRISQMSKDLICYQIFPGEDPHINIFPAQFSFPAQEKLKKTT